MSDLLNRRAVVVGAGIGGLSAAGVLARHFGQVDILERDNIPPSAGCRSGTPQDRHSHGLLAGGLQALCEIFPGFDRDLLKAGAVAVRLAQDVRYERADIGFLPQRDFGRTALCATRPLIEFVLRRRVRALTNVVLRSACRVTEILPATAASVPAVRFNAGSGGAETLHADLVVEASGRGALVQALLDALGWDRPPVTEVGVDITYATAVVNIPADEPRGRTLVLTQPNPPTLARYAVLVPVEGNRWTATLAEYGVRARPESWEAFLEGLRRLHTPTIYEALRRAEPPEGIRHYGFPASVWRHFERLPRLPRGVLPIADAICRFNPIHGQGMSSAAKQARLLWDVLEQSAMRADPLTALQTGFMAEVASVLQTPWSMSTSADLAFPRTRGQRPENFGESREFEAALFRAAVADPVVHRVMMHVAQLLAPASLLHEPDILRRIEAMTAKAAA
jgi:2-polyprenyl-6-methoxyphenol hydroxylase-like FAD-dependent oxidoreductase